MKTYISDGTYLQLQDTEDIRSQFALSSRHESELSLVIPMIKKLEKDNLLLADYISKEEWEKLPNTILLRRITYSNPTKKRSRNGCLIYNCLE